MANRNPGRHVLCPICPKTLRYVTTRVPKDDESRVSDLAKPVPDVHVYECAAHGRFHMGPNGRLHQGA